jgi:putative phosphoribosyl transferase
MIFRNRQEAGRSLAWRLEAYAGTKDVVVLGIPRGGIPVAFEVAEALRAPLGVFIVRKLSVPAQPEHALGAIASGGVRIFDYRILRSLHIPSSELATLTTEAEADLRRLEMVYRGGTAPIPMEGKIAILVDDGVSTGASLLAAIRALRELRPAMIVTAVPVAPPRALKQLGREVDEFICVATPEPFRAVGQFYDDFAPVEDLEISEFLSRNRNSQSQTAA